jgi:hypothetical protein
MGEKITKFVDSFNDGLLKAVDEQNSKFSEFSAIRAEAIKVTTPRLGAWPNDPSVKTLGDLIGYVFPATGGIKNEPPAVLYGTSINQDYLDYMTDTRNDDIGKAYKDLTRTFYNNKIYSELKDHGGGQYWFDLFMAQFKFEKDAISVKIKEIKSNKNDWAYTAWDSVIKDKMVNDGLKVSDYVDYGLFYNCYLEDSDLNDNNAISMPVINLAGKRGGLPNDEDEFIKPENKELRNSDLLYQAFLEAGDDYVGPYTKLFEDPKTPEPTISGTPSVAGLTPSTTGLTPSVTDTANVAVNAALPAAGMTPSKIPLLVNIPSDGFVINAKKDLPNFSIFVGSIPVDINSDVVGNDNTDIDVFDDSQTADDEYSEGNFEGVENIADMSEFMDAASYEPSPTYTFSPLAIEGYDVNEGGAGGSGAGGSGLETDAGGVSSTVVSKSHTGGYDKYDRATQQETWKNDQITVVRESTSNMGVQGVVYFASKAIAVSLEQPWFSEKEKPHTGLEPNENFRCIEAGNYILGFRTSTTNSWLRTQFVKLKDYPNGVIAAIGKDDSTAPKGQRGIRIHAGSHKGHSKGCLLVAEDRQSNGNLVYTRKASDYIITLIYKFSLKKIVFINEFNKGGIGLNKN